MSETGRELAGLLSKYVNLNVVARLQLKLLKGQIKKLVMRERTDITTTTAPYSSTRPGNIPQYFFHEASTPLNSGVPQGLEFGPGAGKLIPPRSHRDWHSSKKKKRMEPIEWNPPYFGPRTST